MISYKILCAAGVLVQGCTHDFLLAIAMAKEAEADWMQRLPESTFRVHFFYPSRKRVPSSEIAAALRALADPVVAAAIARRRAAAAQNSPARSVARTAEFCAAVGRGLAVAVDFDFCQAGVVAPPDSPDLGISFLGSPVASDPFI